MKTVFLLAASLLAASTAQATVTVTFTAPDKFVDVPRSEVERNDTLKDIQRHFEKLGEKLPAGVDWTVEVTDIDLAGRIEPTMRAANDLRIMRGMADWPRMDLSYTLSRAGTVLRTAKATVTDMTYMHHLNLYGRDDAMRYEKQMLDDWFKKDVLPAVK